MRFIAILLFLVTFIYSSNIGIVCNYCVNSTYRHICILVTDNNHPLINENISVNNKTFKTDKYGKVNINVKENSDLYVNTSDTANTFHIAECEESRVYEENENNIDKPISTKDNYMIALLILLFILITLYKIWQLKREKK